MMTQQSAPRLSCAARAELETDDIVEFLIDGWYYLARILSIEYSGMCKLETKLGEFKVSYCDKRLSPLGTHLKNFRSGSRQAQHVSSSIGFVAEENVRGPPVASGVRKSCVNSKKFAKCIGDSKHRLRWSGFQTWATRAI